MAHSDTAETRPAAARTSRRAAASERSAGASVLLHASWLTEDLLAVTVALSASAGHTVSGARIVTADDEMACAITSVGGLSHTSGSHAAALLMLRMDTPLSGRLAGARLSLETDGGEIPMAAYDLGASLTDVRTLIRESSAVICDLSEARPNVLYEAGFAHALDKPTIHICSTPLS